MELDITAPQAWTLFLLASGRCNNISDIAQECGVDASAVTRLLDRMEKRGLVQRIRSATDRRVVQIRLTETGESLATRVPQIMDSVVEHVQAGLTPAEVGFLKSLLRRLHLDFAHSIA